MKNALRGQNGAPIDLKTYVELEGDGDPRKWKNKPRCPDCGAEVHAYDIKGALNFRDAADEVGNKPRARPGFHHMNDAAALDCPQSFRQDPRFKWLKETRFDARTGDRNEAVLMRPEMRALNRAVLGMLMYRMTLRREIPPDDLKRMGATARKLYNLEMLSDNPWVLPYMVALLEGHRERSIRGGTATVTFQSVGSALLPYRDIDGVGRVASIPEKIRLCFVNVRTDSRTGAEAIALNPMRYKSTRGEMAFALSEEAAHALANEYTNIRPKRSHAAPRLGNEGPK